MGHLVLQHEDDAALVPQTLLDSRDRREEAVDTLEDRRRRLGGKGVRPCPLPGIENPRQALHLRLETGGALRELFEGVGQLAPHPLPGRQQLVQNFDRGEPIELLRHLAELHVNLFAQLRQSLTDHLDVDVGVGVGREEQVEASK